MFTHVRRSTSDNGPEKLKMTKRSTSTSAQNSIGRIAIGKKSSSCNGLLPFLQLRLFKCTTYWSICSRSTHPNLIEVWQCGHQVIAFPKIVAQQGFKISQNISKCIQNCPSWSVPGHSNDFIDCLQMIFYMPVDFTGLLYCKPFEKSWIFNAQCTSQFQKGLRSFFLFQRWDSVALL